VHDRINIKEVKPITNKEYIAQGNTALLDALGRTINDIGLKLYNTAENERPGRVIFFIITDGEENASVKYSKEKTKEMVELQKNTYSWEFIFLGANIDSFSAASSIGISADRAFKYEADSEGVFNTHLAMSVAVGNYRRNKSVDKGENFRDKIKKPKGEK
jgi:uncharacterized protein YegL